MKVPFDPEDWRTWPIPAEYVNSRYSDGHPRRLVALLNADANLNGAALTGEGA